MAIATIGNALNEIRPTFQRSLRPRWGGAPGNQQQDQA
jgi:hypothetical protein